MRKLNHDDLAAIDHGPGESLSAAQSRRKIARERRGTPYTPDPAGHPVERISFDARGRMVRQIEDDPFV